MNNCRIYIAGPLTADTPKEMEQNARIAMRWMAELIRAGHTPYCPHLSLYCERLLVEERGAGLDYEEWMEQSAEWLRVCDALLFLGPSPGADRELLLARRWGKIILHAGGRTHEEAMAVLAELTATPAA